MELNEQMLFSRSAFHHPAHFTRHKRRLRCRICQSAATSRHNQTATCTRPHCPSQSITGSLTCSQNGRKPYPIKLASNESGSAFDCIRGTGPAYFKHVCTPASDISGRHITSVLLNAATCWFLAPELSLADRVFQLLHRSSGTLFRHICARH